MKKVVLSLVMIATLAVVSCKDANAEAPATEETVEVVEEVAPVVETVVDSAAAVVDSAAVAAPATEEAAK